MFISYAKQLMLIFRSDNITMMYFSLHTEINVIVLKTII